MRLATIHTIILLLSILYIPIQAQVNYDIIPEVKEIEKRGGYSIIKELRFSQDQLTSLGLDQEWINAIEFPSRIVNKIEQSNVYLAISGDAPEGYILDVNATNMLIETSSVQGVNLALTSAFQLFVLNKNKLPQVRIGDQPVFPYRGMHLDVARHFFPVKDIKKYIDFLAFYKFNTFHWHLTDDQGWRIEIKQYPKLQEISAFRDETLIGHYSDQPQKYDNEKYGGFYTQEEAKEVVQYAKNKGITVIPEIEMPGHSQAVLAAYPELACEMKEYKTATTWGVFEDVFCPSDTTFHFLKNVLDEVMSIFPSEYIHIGGDECPKSAWEKSEFCQNLIKERDLKDEHGLQSYFIRQIEDYLNSKGRQIIGWDEILEGGLAPNASVMSWRGMQGGIEAAEQNHAVIMTPTEFCYFDYYQSDHPDEPLAIGGYLPLEKVYHFNPIPDELSDNKRNYIKGAQGNLWTEYISTFQQVEYMALARMAALSEVVWIKESQQDYPHFAEKLWNHINYWNSQQVNIANHLLDVNVNVFTSEGKGSYVKADCVLEEAKTYVKGPNDQKFTLLSEDSYYLNQDGNYTFYATMNGQVGRSRTINYVAHKGNKAKIQLKKQANPKYGGNGPSSLINGISGNNEKYGDKEWLGFSGDDIEIMLDWKNEQEIHSIDFRFFNIEGQWIYLPSSVQVLQSEDGLNYESLSTKDSFNRENRLSEVHFDVPSIRTNHLKIVVKNPGDIPKGNPGEGNASWMFIDEIIVN